MWLRVKGMWAQALIAVLTAALTVVVALQPRAAVLEDFTAREADMLARAITTAQVTWPEKQAWTKTHSDIYEAYLAVQEMPPTDLVMEHYLYVASKHRLKSKTALMKWMKKELPDEEDY
jgi:hypothetical protein